MQTFFSHFLFLHQSTYLSNYLSLLHFECLSLCVYFCTLIEQYFALPYYYYMYGYIFTPCRFVRFLAVWLAVSWVFKKHVSALSIYMFIGVFYIFTFLFFHLCLCLSLFLPLCPNHSRVCPVSAHGSSVGEICFDSDEFHPISVTVFIFITFKGRVSFPIAHLIPNMFSI
jgi:hypothetical protein